MTLWDRLSRLVRANLNDLLRRAEDPEKIIEQALLDMKQALREAREQVAEALAEQKRLEREVESHEREAALWEEKAREALKAGREDLAREALRRKKRALDLAEGFKAQLSEHKALTERLMTQLKALGGQNRRGRGPQKLLLARKKGWRPPKRYGGWSRAWTSTRPWRPLRRWRRGSWPWRTGTRPSRPWTRPTWRRSSRPFPPKRRWRKTSFV